MAFIDWVEVPNHPALAEGTFLGDAVRKAAELVNDVNDNFPDWARPVPRIIEPWGNAIRTLANKPGPPPIPALPFTGGQCCGTTYEVTYQFTTPDGTGTITSVITGKLGAPQVTSNSSGQVGTVLPYTRCDGVTQYLLGWGNVELASYQAGLYTPITVAAVIPLYGGLNNCGDPIPVYPPTIPTPSDLQRVNNVYIGPSLTIPINFVYIKPEVDVNADINLNFNIPVTIDLPDVGINFNFDAGGITINIGNGAGTTVLPTKPDPRNPTPTKSTPTSNYDSDFAYLAAALKRIKEELDDVKDCACGPTKITQTQTYPAAQSRTISCPADTFLVRLTMQDIPTTARKQYGVNAPDVIYGGWASFGYAGGGWENREPIDYAEKSFIPLKQPQGFSYTCQTGFTASLVVYYQVDSP